MGQQVPGRLVVVVERTNVVATAEHERLEALFSAALDKDSWAEQMAFLDEACGADASLPAR